MATATITKANTRDAAKADRTTTIDLEALRLSWIAAVEGEAVTQSAFDAAKLGLDNYRVIRSRIVYRAAMVTPVKGEPNLLNAARILLTDPDETPAKRTAQAKSRKNTLRNYLAAGAALMDAGLVNNDTEPDDNERKICADVFRELNKRDKAEAKAAKGKGTDAADTADGEATGKVSEDDALTMAEVLAKLAQFKNTLDTFQRNGGIITAGDVDTINGVFADISAGLESVIA